MPNVSQLRRFGVDFVGSPNFTLSDGRTVASSWNATNIEQKIANNEFVKALVSTFSDTYDSRFVWYHVNSYVDAINDVRVRFIRIASDVEFKETPEGHEYLDVEIVTQDGTNPIAFVRLYRCAECGSLYLSCDYFYSHHRSDYQFICTDCIAVCEQQEEEERISVEYEEDGGSSNYYIDQYKSFDSFRPLEYGVSPFRVWGNKILLSKDQKKKFSSELFSSKKRPFPLYGIELECVARSRYDTNQTWLEVCEYLEDVAIVKCDGSLPEDGFEIVSLPGTLEFHQEFWPVFFKRFEGKLAGFRHKSCGMHIHLGKEFLGSMDQVKIVKFINSHYNRNFVEGIAQRKANDYCLLDVNSRTISNCFSAPSYVYKNAVVNHVDGRLVVRRVQSSFKSTEYRYFEKYRAVNIGVRNKDTIEFRMFQSNVAPTGFLKNIEFIDALLFFCTTTSFKFLFETDFRNQFYYGKNSNLYRSKYPNLDYFMQRELNADTGYPSLSDVTNVKGKIHLVKEPTKMKTVTKERLEKACNPSLDLGLNETSNAA